MPAQRATGGREGQRLGRRELEAGRDEAPAHALLEVMPPAKDFARPGRQLRLAPPVELDATGALVPDDRCAEIRARQLGGGRRGALDRLVDGAVDRLDRE